MARKRWHCMCTLRTMHEPHKLQISRHFSPDNSHHHQSHGGSHSSDCLRPAKQSSESRRSPGISMKLKCALDTLPHPRQSVPDQQFHRDARRGGTRLKNLLRSHGEILICRNEVCGVIIPGVRTEPKSSDASDVIRIKDPRIAIAVHLAPEDCEEAQNGHEHMVKLSKINVASIAAPPQDVVQGIMIDMQKFNDASAQERFTQHVSTYFQCLRAVHTTTTKTDHAIAAGRLDEYVYTKSFSKMLARFASGSRTDRSGHKTNFWDILIRKTLPDHACNIPVPAELASRTPNAAQAAFIKALFASSEERGSLITRSIYQSHPDRLRFHSILRILLHRALEALKQLDAEMQDVASKPLPEVKATVKTACSSVSTLLDFMMLFDAFMEPHIEWLAECANVVDLKDTPTWTVPLPESHTRSCKNATTDARAPKDCDDDEDTKEFVNAQESARQIQADQNVEARPYQPWASGCKAFMWLACLHESSLRWATLAVPGQKRAPQKYESALIAQAQVTVINFHTRLSNHETAKIDEALLAKLRYFEPALDPSKLLGKPTSCGRVEAAALGYLDDAELCKPRSWNSNIKGAPHGGAILMSLVHIAKDKTLMDRIDNKWLEAQGIFATTEDLLGLPDATNLILASMDVEPHSTRSRTRTGKLHMGVTGSRSKWPGSLLPTIMHKQLGLVLLECTFRETATRLLAFQRLIDAKTAVVQSPRYDEITAPWRYATSPISPTRILDDVIFTSVPEGEPPEGWLDRTNKR